MSDIIILETNVEIKECFFLIWLQLFWLGGTRLVLAQLLATAFILHFSRTQTGLRSTKADFALLGHLNRRHWRDISFILHKRVAFGMINAHRQFFWGGPHMLASDALLFDLLNGVVEVTQIARGHARRVNDLVIVELIISSVNV